jgi:hypothetical protein
MKHSGCISRASYRRKVCCISGRLLMMSKIRINKPSTPGRERTLTNQGGRALMCVGYGAASGTVMMIQSATQSQRTRAKVSTRRCKVRNNHCSYSASQRNRASIKAPIVRYSLQGPVHQLPLSLCSALIQSRPSPPRHRIHQRESCS